jgi:hypothetical protein
MFLQHRVDCEYHRDLFWHLGRTSPSCEIEREVAKEICCRAPRCCSITHCGDFVSYTGHLAHAARVRFYFYGGSMKRRSRNLPKPLADQA